MRGDRDGIVVHGFNNNWIGGRIDAARLAAGTEVVAAVLDRRHAGIADYQLVVPQLFLQHQQTQRIFQAAQLDPIAPLRHE